MAGIPDEGFSRFQAMANPSPSGEGVLSHQILAFDRPNHLREIIGRHGRRAGELAWVDAVVVNREGRVFIADTGNNRVQVLDRQRRVLKIFGGEGTQPGFFRNPRSLALDEDGDLYVADWGNHCIQVFDRQSVIEIDPAAAS